MNRLLLSTLLCLSFAATQAATVADQAPTIEAQQNQEQLARAQAHVEHVAQLANNQLMAADYLAQALQADVMQSKIENREILPILNDIRSYLQEYQYKEARTPTEFIKRVEVVAAMVRHINDGVMSHFKHWNFFQAPLLSRSEEKLAMADMLTYIERLSLESLELIEQTNTEIPFIGVGPMRRAVRKTAEFIRTYSPPKAYIWGTVGIGAVSLWLLFNIQDDAIHSIVDEGFLSRFPKIGKAAIWLKNKVGNPPVSGPHGEPYVDLNGNRVKERAGLITPLYNGVTQAGFVLKDTRTIDVLGKMVTFFGLPAAGSYFAEQLRLRYDKVHQYLLGNSGSSSATVIKTPKTGFDDVIGNEAVKATLEKFIEHMITPERFDRIDSNPGFAVLLTGETRSGKTFLAERLCGEVNHRLAMRGAGKEVHLIEIKAGLAEAYKDYFGSICNAIRYYIDQHAPCIIFIDEIHLLGLNKDKNPQMLSDFLTLLSGVEKMNATQPCLIVGATNYPELLDKALHQKGRFGTQIILSYPNAAERAEFIQRRLELSGIKTEDQFIAEFVIKTQGLSFETIEELIRHQKRQALMYQQPITPESLDVAFDNVVYEIQEDAHPLVETEARLVSVNAASKLIAHHLIDPTNSKRIIARSTVLPVTRRIKIRGDQNVDLKTIKQRGAVFSYLQSEPSGVLNEADLRHEALMLLAGHAGEEIVLQSRALSDQDFDPDMYQAYELCLKMVMRGMKMEDLSKERQNRLREQAYELMLSLEQQAKEMLSSHGKEIEMVASMLDHVKIANQQLIDVMYYIIDNPEQVQQQLKELEDQFAQQDAQVAAAA